MADFPSPTGMGPPDQPVGGGSRLQVLGVNQLQTSIDALTSAVQSLSSKLGGSSGWAGSGATFTSAPMMNATATGGNGATGFSNPGFPSPSGMFRSPVGQVPPPTLNAMSSGGNGGWGSAATGAFAGSNLPGAMSALGNYGSGQLGTMAAISAMNNQTAFFGGSASGMMNQSGFGVTLNMIANSANDRAQGQALMGYASGAWGGSNPLYRGMAGAVNMAGFVNPTLGLTGSAALAQQLYGQQMSMSMLAMGYGMTPRMMNGGTNSIQSVNSAILQRTFGGRSVNQAAFNASAAPGGRLNYNLQALGLSGTDLVNMETMLSTQNRLANAGWSNSKISSVFAGAAHMNGSAIGQLKGVLGPNAVDSILQTLKNKNAISDQRSGSMEQSYQSGLATSVRLLNDFNKAINKLMQDTPLGKLIGYGSGMGSSGILGAASDFMSGNIFGGFKALIGGGAAAPAASGMTSSKRTSSPAGAVSGAANAAVGWAKQEIGVPYLWGGEQPGVGFDCSGLTQWAYKQAGVNIPRTSQQQWAALSRGHSIGLNQVQAGDLVFTAGSDGTYAAPGHVAMAVGPNTLIQAEQTGTNIMLTGYDPRQWDHAARPTGPGTAGTGPSGSGAPGGGTGLGMASGYGGMYSEGGSMGSTSELDAISGIMPGGYMSGFTGQVGTTGNRNPGSGGRGAPGAPANLTRNAALAKSMAAKRGWTGTQWNDLYALWTRESGFNQYAKNPSSGAYGIPQSLPANKMASAGADYMTNPGTQIKWGLGYIGGRYKDPAGAWAHEQQFGWYARGTNNMSPGVSIVGENGPEAVVSGGGQSILTAGQTAGALAAIQSGQGRARGGLGGGVSLTVSIGQISVSGGSDVSSSAREIASQIGSYLEQEDIIQKLAAGVSC